MYRILNNLATHGIGEPGIIEKYVNCEVETIDDFRIIDVKDVDRWRECYIQIYAKYC